MRIESFEWDEHNEGHIAKHRVSPDEVEEIFIHSPLLKKTREGRYLAFGQSLDGRYLFVVFMVKSKSRIRPITAREMDKKELKLYKKWIGGKKP